ncbi:DUF4265 domain-containing protein [uncultured Oceanicoccus sp.]|uniref:DUF4265 domain-containing protein n=1 Tax=uncultured Oceanicoccus sp. TaxID=1706381 RepID=UPI0030D9465E
MTDKQSAALIGSEPTIELIAGRHPNGELVVEKVLVNPQSEENSYQLLKSPVFVRGIARADVIQSLEKPKGAFKVLKHGGNLCLRVFSKDDFSTTALSALEQALTSEIEKLGGDLDIKEPKALVYSIHVSCGFNAVEKILDDALSSYDDVAWFYGNVYDPETGEPLNWWQPILAPE